MTSIAVVGAGPAGLTALVALARAGLDVTCFEKGDRPGGLWAYGAPLSGAYRSLHLNTSRARTELAGFPMPADWPDFPSHEYIGRYFADYVEHAGVGDRIRYGAAVTRAERGSGGGWTVTAEDGFEGRFDHLVVASGHNWEPAWPDPPYPGDFDGVQVHAHDYREPGAVRGPAGAGGGHGQQRHGHRGRGLDRRRAGAAVHPLGHPDRAQVRVRQARRPGHLAGHGPAALAAAPAADPRDAAGGRRQARELRAAAGVGRVPALAPHHQRLGALAPDPRRDRGPARASSRCRAGRWSSPTGAATTWT